MKIDTNIVNKISATEQNLLSLLGLSMADYIVEIKKKV